MDYLGWRAWFKADEPGGARTPAMELADVYAARAYAGFFNVHHSEDVAPAEIRDFLEFPPVITEEQSDAEYCRKVENMGRQSEAMYASRNARLGA